MGALPGENGADNLTWQSFQNAYGPAIDGMFSQSNFGIVTKMGFWLMPATGSQSYLVTFPREDDFEQIVDLIRPLAASRVFGNVPQLRHVVQELAVTGKPRSHFWPEGSDKAGRMPRSIIAREAAKRPLGDVSWVFYDGEEVEVWDFARPFIGKSRPSTGETPSVRKKPALTRKLSADDAPSDPERFTIE